MKKLSFFCIIILFCFTACGNQNSGSSTSADESKNSSVPSQTESEGSSSNSTDDLVKIETKEYEGRLAIVLEDTNIQNPYCISVNDKCENVIQSLSDGEYSLEANDLVVVYSDNGDNYKIILPCGDIPRVMGTIYSKFVSFDTDSINLANQAIIENKMCYDAKDGNEIGSESGSGRIISREDGWAQMTLVGSGVDVWVKEDDLSYDFDTTVEDIAQ